MPPGCAYADAITHCPPGTTTRSSGARCPQTYCASVATHGGAGGAAGGCCAIPVDTDRTTAIPARTSVLMGAPCGWAPGPGALALGPAPVIEAAARALEALV